MSNTNREMISSFATDEEQSMAKRVLDLIDQTMNTADPQYTSFLNPTEQEVLRIVTRRFPEIRYMAYGGYRTAERKKAVIMPSFFINEHLELGISALEITPVDEIEGELTHGDYLGSIMSLGLKRGKIGDIIVVDKGAQLVIDSDIVEYIITNLRKINRYSVDSKEIDLERLDVVPERTQDIERTVASLRLDTVAAAGYSTSRTKMAKDIKARRVKVNWKEVTSPNHQIEVGDVMSISGRGRVILEEILGETRKGRIRIQLKKLI